MKVTGMCMRLILEDFVSINRIGNLYSYCIVKFAL